VDGVADAPGESVEVLPQFGAGPVEDTLHRAEFGPGATVTARTVHGSTTVARVHRRAAPAPREVMPVAEAGMGISPLFGFKTFEFCLQRSELRQILLSEIPVELKNLRV